MLSSSILLSSCSSVITNDNSNIEKPVPSLDLMILHNNVVDNANEIIENDFDIFLKNLGFVIEKTTITQNWHNHYEIINKICNILNTMNIIKFDKVVKYNFYLFDGKEIPDFISEFISYKIIL